MEYMNPMLYTDCYKLGHIFQYPRGTEYVYSNATARASRMDGVDYMVYFGGQYFIQEYLSRRFTQYFFERSLAEVLDEYKEVTSSLFGGPLESYQHIEDLHRLGYLPVEIKTLPEGSFVPLRVPYLTIQNTDPRFYWLTNYLESLMSCVLWQPCTSATIASQYRFLLDYAAKATGMDPSFVDWQGHDFSFRGMSSPESAMTSGMGHLLFFEGTDSIPAVVGMRNYYQKLRGGSVPATEHAVMCAGQDFAEFETFKRLITEVYPTGIVSIVSDTWNLWTVLGDYLPRLKDVIMAREGKVVIRPDSGDPVDILCGPLGHVYGPPVDSMLAKKGVIECLWDVFGGTISPTGHKLLDPHIGAIYGDSITLERARKIYARLAAKGFANQTVLGIGSFTYQHNTRDTFGNAIKATYVEVNGEGRDIFKSPVTDDGTKKSAKGLLQVLDTEDGYVLKEGVTKEEERQGELRTVFHNGLWRRGTYDEIAAHISRQMTRRIVSAAAS